MTPVIAVIGAGVGGLHAAHTLRAHGAHVTLFDKAFFPGGRLSTRRLRDHDAWFDHGAQYFTAKSPELSSFVDIWREEHVVTPWEARLVALPAAGHQEPLSQEASAMTRWVGVPHMNQLAIHLARSLHVRSRHLVHAIVHQDGRYVISSEDAEGATQEFAADAIVFNLPPGQLAPLVDGHSEELVKTARAVEMLPCWSSLHLFPRGELDAAGFDGAFVNISSSALSWISLDSSKPSRSGDYDALVLHASVEWSKAHIELAQEEVVSSLLDDFFASVGERLQRTEPLFSQAHRWRYARPDERDDLEPLARIDSTQPLVACGDWLDGGKVEGAFLSGRRAAALLVERLGLTPSEESIWTMR